MMSSSKTELFFAVLLIFSSVLSESATEPFKPAPNCARLECPAYTVVHTDKDFEIRSYVKANWVAGPEIKSNSYTKAAFEGFRLLFNYFDGNNKQGIKVKMTAPVAIEVQNSNYQVYFYLPKMYQTLAPVPLTKDILKDTLPHSKYAAVRRYGGFISDNNIPKELDALKASLKGTPYEKAINATTYTVLGYNSPFELFNRVNEVSLGFN